MLYNISMRRAFLILILIIFTALPSFSDDSEKLPNIFIWSTPSLTQVEDNSADDKNSDASEDEYLTEEEVEKIAAERDARLLKEQEDSVKQKKLSKKEKKAIEESEQLKLVQIKDEDTIAAGVLKGYAEYKEGADAVYLKDDNDEFILNIRKPQAITSTNIDLKKSNMFQQKYIDLSKYTSDEYRIASSNVEIRSNINSNFSFGTGYDSGLSRSQLEKTTSFFAEYKYKKLSLGTTFERYSGDMYGGKYYDTYYFIPTYKLNENVSVKGVFGADIVNSRKTSEFVLQYSPLANKGNDRLNFEIGTKQYFDNTNEMYRTRLRFSTMFKL